MGTLPLHPGRIKVRADGDKMGHKLYLRARCRSWILQRTSVRTLRETLSLNTTESNKAWVCRGRFEPEPRLDVHARSALPVSSVERPQTRWGIRYQAVVFTYIYGVPHETHQQFPFSCNKPQHKDSNFRPSGRTTKLLGSIIPTRSWFCDLNSSHSCLWHMWLSVFNPKWSSTNMKLPHRLPTYTPHFHNVLRSGWRSGTIQNHPWSLRDAQG